AMGIIAGSEATDAAKASTIIDGFQKISAAMMTYYSDNYAAADAGTTTAADILEGVQAYIKTEDASLVAADDTAAARTYNISIVGEANPKTWWLTYTLDGADTKIGAILETKATKYGLKKATSSTTNDYDGKATVCMKVR
ncbi:MAG: hypothetical protein IJG37_05050, partial [Synergistaceae bacterium]|nr:hypothetical protein [Synergistaceae bacterium]